MQLVAPETIPNGEIVPLEDKVRIHNLCMEMIKVCESEHGIGLSAVQLGVPWKMFVVKDRDRYRCFLNCVYEPTNDAKRTHSLEGCLSLRSPDGRLRFFELERWNRIKVSGTEFNYIEIGFFDYMEDISLPLAVVFQHEIDHDQGKLISDQGKEVTLF